VSTPEEPVDLHAVAADDAALEALRATAGDDAALVLLRELLLDVERDLPLAPVSHGSTVLAIAGEEPQSRRLARGGTVLVATLTAGALSLGGVAAAAPADSPLHGLGEGGPLRRGRRRRGDHAARDACAQGRRTGLPVPVALAVLVLGLVLPAVAGHAAQPRCRRPAPAHARPHRCLAQPLAGGRAPGGPAPPGRRGPARGRPYQRRRQPARPR
jgi:hypothetical protein